MEVEPIVVEYITIIINLRESLSYVNLSDSDMTFIFFFTSYRPMFSLLIHGQEYWANDKLLKVIPCFWSSCHPGLWKGWFFVTAACACRPWANWWRVILLLWGSFWPTEVSKNINAGWKLASHFFFFFPLHWGYSLPLVMVLPLRCCIWWKCLFLLLPSRCKVREMLMFCNSVVFSLLSCFLFEPWLNKK